MGMNNDKGYRGEVGALQLLAPIGQALHRPRTTSYHAVDTGDIHGLPLVVSVKNHQRIELSAWCDELTEMVSRSRFSSGIVIAKRIGRGDPRSWYVISTGELAQNLIYGYCDWADRNGDG